MRRRYAAIALAVAGWALVGPTNVAQAQTSVTLLDVTTSATSNVAPNPRGTTYFNQNHTIVMTAGGSYTLRTKTGTTIGATLNGGYFDSYIYLLNPSGQVVAQDDDSNGTAGGDGGTFSSKISNYTPTVSGTYTLVVTTFSPGQAIQYEVIITGPPGTTPPTPVPPTTGIPNVRLEREPQWLDLDRVTVTCRVGAEPRVALVGALITTDRV
jgi:hypothetical protein